MVEVGDMIILEWKDAHTSTDEFSFTELHERHKPWTITTVGWLLQNDEVGVSLANELTGTDTYRGHTFVLKSMVVSVKPYKTPRKRKAKVDSLSPTLIPHKPEASVTAF